MSDPRLLFDLFSVGFFTLFGYGMGYMLGRLHGKRPGVPHV